MNYIAGLDIGSTKLALVIGKIDRKGTLEIVEFCKGNSEGVRNGVVVDVNRLTNSILALKESLRIKRFFSVLISINGREIRSHFTHSALNLSLRGEEIKEWHLEALKRKGRNISLPLDRKIICSFPLEYVVDGEEEIINPVRMTGTHIQIRLHLISSRIGMLENLIKSVNYAGWEVEECVPISVCAQSALDQYPSALFLDIGAQTINMGISTQGVLRFSFCEVYKKEEFSSLMQRIKEKAEELKYGEVNKIVLSGGRALEEGMPERVEEALKMPVEIGISSVRLQKQIAEGEEKEVIENPVYTVSLGLVKYGVKKRKERRKGRIWTRLRRWIEGYF